MDLEGITLSEINQKDKYCYEITYVWNLKTKTKYSNNNNKNNFTKIEIFVLQRCNIKN